MNSVTDIETQLHHLLLAQELIASNTHWHAQTGGRTNKVWHLKGDQDLICKLYLDASENPLYANTPAAEYAVLCGLAGAGVAPDPHGFVETPFGAVLLYHYIEGRVWGHDTEAVAQLIGRVHQLAPPLGLRVLSGSSADIAAQGLNILDMVETEQSDELCAMRPELNVADVTPVLIHTDVVAGNLIYGPEGLRLIDWQCPALGDPVVDVAMFLSPAMHMIYGDGPLPKRECDAFLSAINPKVRERYMLIGPLYHWRMAAYCLWRADQGVHGYADAANAEIAFLKQA
jgi:aminoglycoside phosphotransferase (APT) family kinase protein